jgi:membrane-associated phospholipid phosphatase
MHDAVFAAWHWKYRYQRRPPRIEGSTSRPQSEPSYPSEHAAIAGAASRVLAYLFSARSTANLDRKAKMAARSQVIAGASYPSDVRAGLVLGRKIAAAVIARAKSDGFSRSGRGARPRGPQYWRPSPGSNARPVQPLAGKWRTWVLESGSALRPPPPPAYGSKQFLAEALEVKRLQASLGPEQKRIAKFWEGGVGTPLPPGVWNQVAIAYALRDRLDVPMTVRLFALLNISMADTGIAVWDSKFHYSSARPENAIKDLGLGAKWEPFLATPPFPSYVSAHSAFSAAAATILAQFFPNDAERFEAKAEEAGMSRLFGGIHFRSDHTVGLSMGEKVGRLVLEGAAEDD